MKKVLLAAAVAIPALLAGPAHADPMHPTGYVGPVHTRHFYPHEYRRPEIRHRLEPRRIIERPIVERREFVGHRGFYGGYAFGETGGATYYEHEYEHHERHSRYRHRAAVVTSVHRVGVSHGCDCGCCCGRGVSTAFVDPPDNADRPLTSADIELLNSVYK